MGRSRGRPCRHSPLPGVLPKPKPKPMSRGRRVNLLGSPSLSYVAVSLLWNNVSKIGCFVFSPPASYLPVSQVITSNCLLTSQIYLQFIWFILTWPVTISPKYQIIWTIWFLIGYLHQLFCKLNYGNLKNLWQNKNTYIWRSFFNTATLGSLSCYHNLIWKQCTTSPFCALEFLSHRRFISVW